MRKFVERMQELSRDERGMETVHSVAITGIAAVAIAATFKWRWAIVAWVQSVLTTMLQIPT